MKRIYEKKKKYLVLDPKDLKFLRKLVKANNFKNLPYAQTTINNTLYGKSHNPIIIRNALQIYIKKLKYMEERYKKIIEDIKNNQQ